MANNLTLNAPQKMCRVGPPLCFMTAKRYFYHCKIDVRIVWSATSLHLCSSAFWRYCKYFTLSLVYKFLQDVPNWMVRKIH